MTLLNKQFNKLVKVTVAERQQITDQTDGNEKIQVVAESAKS